MENLENYKIASLGLALQRKGDLLYHEGPLLTHFINSENANEHYFYKWSDIDENCNRWLIFKVTIENLTSFFGGCITLLQLIQKNQFVYFVDLDTDINEVNAFICPTSKIPNDYLPSEKSFFKESQYEKYALTLRHDLQKEQERAYEKGIIETLLKEVYLMKENQKQQSLQLGLILKNLEKKQISPKDIHWLMIKEKGYSIDSSDLTTLNNLINTQNFSNYEPILN